MGYYINRTPSGETLPAHGKAAAILATIPGSKVLAVWGKYQTASDVPRVEYQPDLVCVVENLLFDAAGFAYDENEFRIFSDLRDDPRRRTWMTVPGAAEISGYSEFVAAVEAQRQRTEDRQERAHHDA